MKIIHSSIKSPVYELLKVLEVDLQLNDEFRSARFELFRNTENDGQFRCRILQAEPFRIQSVFAQTGNGSPQSGELIWVEFKGFQQPYQNFEATDSEAALELVLADFRRFLEHTTGGSDLNGKSAPTRNNPVASAPALQCFQHDRSPPRTIAGQASQSGDH